MVRGTGAPVVTVSLPIPVLLMVGELGPGGTERQVTELARNLDPEHFAATVGSFRSGVREADLEASHIPVQHFPVTSFINASAVQGAWALGNYLRRHKVQILHTFDAPMNIFAAPVGKSLGTLGSRRPKVITSQRGHRSLLPQPRSLLRLTDHIADAIVVNCEYIRNHLIDEEGVPQDKIRLCYNGLDTSHFYPNRRRDEATFTIGVTCVLRPEKGLTTLMRAFAQVRYLRPGLRLCLVGSGSMLEELRQLGAELGIAGETHFEPATSDVRPWLNQMDVFVLPSLDEALSNSLTEAMACGCAVVASNIGGNPELVRSGETGLLFEKENVQQLASQLQLLIENRDLRTSLADAAARSIATHFSVERSVRRMTEIYREALD